MSDAFSTYSQPEGGFAAISKYNPHLWSAEQLRAIFVARTNELADLLHTLRTTKPDTVGQHVLLVGARGMGKSTLMRRLALAVEDDSNLSADWLPLRFPEEQYTVATLGQFWANVLDSLADALQHQGESVAELDAAAERIAALPAAEQAEACLAAIDRCADERGKRLLLLVDNTDLLLRNLGRDAHWALRATLQSNPRLLWIGGSYQTLEAESDYHDAFLDFFRPIHLRPLTVEEMRQALLALAETFGKTEGRDAMKRQLDAQPERLPTLRQLSGGNPRTTVMLYEILANGQKGSVRSDLEALLDNMTPLYKARMEALADLPRKLFAHILEHWAPISVGDLSAVSQVPNTTISGQLKRLELDGLIAKTSLHGTTRSGYQAAERFFNIWYLMRLSPRRQRSRLNWLVEFMRLWFSADELCALAQQRMRDGRSALRSLHELEYDRALSDALPDYAPERHALRWSLVKQLKENKSQFAELFDLEGEDAEFKGADDYLRRLCALASKLRECPYVETEENKNHLVEAVIGSISLNLAQKEQIAELFKALPRRVEYDKLLDVFHKESRKLKEVFSDVAVQAVNNAVFSHNFFLDMPDSHLAYEQIRTCFADNKDALRLVSQLFFDLHKDEWCYKAHKLAQNALPQDAEIAYRCGILLHYNLSRYEEAELEYRNAILLNEQKAEPWNDLGILLIDGLGRYEESEEAFRKAVTLNNKSVYYWNNLGLLLHNHLGRYQDAEVAYHKAIEVDEKDPQPWNDLGTLLSTYLGRYEEAEFAYRKAIELDEKFALFWSNLGYLLTEHFGRFDEAEMSFRYAISLDKKFAPPWKGLGDLLSTDLKRADEAELAYRQAIAIEEGNAFLLQDLARLLARLGRKEEAESLFREAIIKTAIDNQELLLQAHLYLDNRQLAMNALLEIATKAQAGDQNAFFLLKEQVWECSELGLGERLADWMAESEAAGFLAPFIQALYTLAGADGKLRDLPVESQQMVDEIVRQARLRQAKK
ncbi:MAG: tetratricopeptide repeat protein [Chlorobaculum sp.]|nr:tetratricopeptide repeat protein [Chlorobaculum sp.]